MNYPLVSDYIESILYAEDNFATLTNLRPVLDEAGQPIMSSGNFAVVFKMRDVETKKTFAIKCFLKEQLGREYAYKEIYNELQSVDSKYIADFQYLENELFVALSDGEDLDMPVLVMDWIEGVPLDKFVEQNADDTFRLKYLAYSFAEFTEWLLTQPFAHGDLKPDNLLVQEDCSIVMIDYDGMFVPSLRQNIVNEIGSPNYQHPSRTASSFSKSIDDFSLLVITIELQYYILFKESKCFPLFCISDFYNITNSEKVKGFFPSTSIVLNSLVNALITSILDNTLTVQEGTFAFASKRIRNEYFEASDILYEQIKKAHKEDDYGMWAYRTHGYVGHDYNYPICLSVYVDHYSFKHDGYPCVIKDGCLLAVSDEDGGCYQGECWDEDWGVIVVPDEIVTIADEAFKNCDCVQLIVLPNTIKSIGNNVFNRCERLQFIVLPEKIERIGHHLLNLWPDNYIETKGCEDLELIEQFEKELLIPTSEINGYRSSFRDVDVELSGIRQEYHALLDVYNESCCAFKNFLVPNGCKEYYQKLMPQYKDYIMDFSDFQNSPIVKPYSLMQFVAKAIGTNHTNS